MNLLEPESGMRIIESAESHIVRLTDVYDHLDITQGMSDVDFCWQNNGVVWMLELKHTVPRESDLNDICKKMCNSILLLSAIWLGSNKGMKARGIVNEVFHSYKMNPIYAILVYRQEAPSKLVVSTILDLFRKKLAGIIELFGSHKTKILILSLEEAQKEGLPLQKIEM